MLQDVDTEMRLRWTASPLPPGPYKINDLRWEQGERFVIDK